MKTVLVSVLSFVFAGVAMAGSVISSSQAKDHLGEKDIGVAGFVKQVYERSGNMYVSFQVDKPHQGFVGMVPLAKIDAAGGLLFLNTLPGQFVAITGKIQKQSGVAQIVVLDKKQFLVAQ